MKPDGKKKWEKPSKLESCISSGKTPFVSTKNKKDNVSGACMPDTKCSPETICGPQGCKPYRS